jgi:hypothetical protein
MVQRDVVHRPASASRTIEHTSAGGTKSRLHRVIGAQAFEYLLAQALAEIGAERVPSGSELEANRSLIRARLRLLRQQGPGLGSMFGGPPAARGEQARLEAELLENERQMASASAAVSRRSKHGTRVPAERYSRTRSVMCSFEQKQLRLTAMNVVTEKTSGELAAEVDFHVAELNGDPPVRRAFVVARVERSELPAASRINFDAAARYL